jgi:hypothetical protein
MLSVLLSARNPESSASTTPQKGEADLSCCAKAKVLKALCRQCVQQLEGAGVPYEPLPESLQRIMEDLDYQI